MINAVVAAIYNALKGDLTLMAALGGNAGNFYKVFHIVAPQDAALPYITYGLLTDIPMGVFGNLSAIEDATFWFNVFSTTGQKNLGELAGYLMDVLDDATLTITGYSHLVCAREFMGNILYDPEVGVFQIPLRYRIMVDKD